MTSTSDLTAAMRREMAAISRIDDPAQREIAARELGEKLAPLREALRRQRSAAVLEWLQGDRRRTQAEAAARFGISESTLRGLLR